MRASDPTHPLHVNPHSLVNNLAENNDDLPAWAGIVGTLGCSIHPSWHFGLLGRDQYTLGVSYVNGIAASAAVGKPHSGYCVIAFIPNGDRGTNLLLVKGTGSEETQTAGEFLSSPEQMKKLQAVLGVAKLGHFEVLLRTRKLYGAPLDVQIVSARGY